MHKFLLLVVLLQGQVATLHTTKYHFLHSCNKQAVVDAKNPHNIFVKCVKV